MSNYQNTKATIAANVYTNHNNEVTAEMVKAGINAVVDTLIAGGFLYKGVATTSTNPGSPDANVFYIATAPGTYTNFGSLVVADGEVCILKYNGSWSKEVTGAATAAEVTALGQEVDENTKLRDCFDSQMVEPKNLLNPDYIVTGKYINISTGVIQDYASRDAFLWIPVTPGEKYGFTTDRSTSDPTRIVNGIGDAFFYSGISYDGSTFIEMQSTSGTYTAPAGAQYMCIGGPYVRSNIDLKPMCLDKTLYPSASEPYEAYFAPYTEYIPDATLTESKKAADAKAVGDVISSLPSTMIKGKKILLFGDSITADSPAGNWVNHFIEYTGAVKIKNYAVAGAAWAHPYAQPVTYDASHNTLPNQVQLCLDEYAGGTMTDNPDIIILSAGTNDQAQGLNTNIREVFFGPNASKNRYIDIVTELDISNTYAALRWCVEKLSAQFPSAKFCVFGPIQAYCGENGSGVDNSTRYPDYLRKRNELMEETCGYLSCHFSNGYNDSGVYSRFENKNANGRYLEDGLHPNAAGKILLAKYAISVISRLLLPV